MFRGEFAHNIDPKGRLMIPAKFREELGENFVVTKQMDGCLSIFTEASWAVFEKKLFELPRSKENIRRFFVASSIDTGLDKQGRVLLSPALKTYAALEKEVVVVGLLDHLEIWDKERWNQNNILAEQNLQADMEELGF